MRYGIVSDIHSNLAALEAVLSDMGQVDRLWCLGDVVGYGPDPNECVELIRRKAEHCIVGNHDLAALGLLDTSNFNPAAATAAAWTAAALSEDSRQYLLALPSQVTAEPFTLVHGSPREPIWEYITHEGIAAPNFARFTTTGCLVGHTHVPALFVADTTRGKTISVQSRVPGPHDQYQISRDSFIANPGGVGQPRDGDPRAAYLIYDTDSRILFWKRVEYPIETTQQRMRNAGLPQRLIDRLAHGW